MEKIKVTIWNEFRHEKTNEAAKALYPNGIHATIGEFLSKEDDIEVRLAALVFFQRLLRLEYVHHQYHILIQSYRP